MKCPKCQGTECKVEKPVLASDYSFVNADYECRSCGAEGTAHYGFAEVDLYTDSDDYIED